MHSDLGPEPVPLLAHGTSSAPAVRRLAARVQLEGLLRVTYALEGDVGALRIPSPRAARVADNLWQHTCFELFIAQHGMPGYHEFNFSPSGEWAAYAFTAYRTRLPLRLSIPAPGIEVDLTEGRMNLHATVELAPPLPVRGRIALGLAAVVEDARGELSYWALRHTAEKPDFHRADSFTLTLDAVRN